MAKISENDALSAEENTDEQRIVLFESSDGAVLLSVNVEEETVWLTQAQMAELFERSIAVISLMYLNRKSW